MGDALASTYIFRLTNKLARAAIVCQVVLLKMSDKTINIILAGFVLDSSCSVI